MREWQKVLGKKNLAKGKSKCGIIVSDPICSQIISYWSIDFFSFNIQNNILINGTEVPVVLIGDPAYPLKKWLMKGFPNNGHLTPEQMRFNFRLSSARMVVENAFGRLKGRWRRLLKRNDVSTSFASDVAATCCILHNICEIHKDRYDPQWDIAMRAEEEERGIEQPHDNREPGNQHDHVRARAIRDAIMQSL